MCKGVNIFRKQRRISVIVKLISWCNLNLQFAYNILLTEVNL